MTNQDEEEVEDELAAMEREVTGVSALPAAPNVVQEDLPDAPDEVPMSKVEEREREPIAA